VARDEARLLIVGLGGSGKTSFLERIKSSYLRSHRPAPASSIGPTIGVNLFKAGVQDMEVTIWDVGGSMRSMWEQYSREADCTLFIVDAADRSRFGEAAAALEQVLAATAGPLVILANKQDLPDAARASEVLEAVCRPAGLGGSGERRAYRLLESCAIKAGDGTAKEAVEWLVSSLERS